MNQVYESPSSSLIKQMLKGVGFTPYERVFRGLASEQVLQVVPDSPHSIAAILGHMQYWQTWTLLAITGKFQPLPAHAAEGWPECNAATWPKLLEDFLLGLEQAISLTEDKALLERPVIVGELSNTWIDHHSVGSALAEVIAFHNAHHLGQIILLRRMLGAWPPEGGGMTW